jgi:hypothetical protein
VVPVTWPSDLPKEPVGYVYAIFGALLPLARLTPDLNAATPTPVWVALGSVAFDTPVYGPLAVPGHGFGNARDWFPLPVILKLDPVTMFIVTPFIAILLPYFDALLMK